MGADQTTKEHIQARQVREHKVFQQSTQLERERQTKIMSLQQRETARDQRIREEREKDKIELARRAHSEACRREEVRMEGIRMAEDISLAHSARAKMKSEKGDALVGETRRINQHRKDASAR